MPALNTDTQLERVDLTAPNAPTRIKDACDKQGQNGRRLVAASRARSGCSHLPGGE